MYKINLEFPALILSLLCIIYSLLVKKRQYIPPKGLKNKILSQHFVFLVLLTSHFLATLSSVIGVHLQSLGKADLRGWIYAFNEAYFVFHAVLSVAFTMYMMNVNGASGGKKTVFYVFFLLPFLLDEILVLTNPFTDLVFGVNPSGVYERGPLMPFLYLFGGVYLILSFYYFFRYKRAISRADSFAIGFVIILAGLGIICQAVFSECLLELFAEALAFLALLILLEERSGHLDPVTGAMNKKAFNDTNRRLLETKRDYSVIIVKLTNLDFFSKAADPTEIDHLLMEISEFLSTVASEENIYSPRYGVFALVGTDKTDRQNRHITAIILDRFGRDWNTKIGKLRVDAVISVIKSRKNINKLGDVDDYLNADYPKNKTGSYIVNADEMDLIGTRISIEKNLKRVIAENRLTVFYQPIWSTEKNRTIAAEALLRTDDEELGKYSPEVYIPIAEKNGLIREIGYAVFDKVCRFCAERDLEKLGLEYIELNLSVYQLVSDDVVEGLEKIRKKYGVPPEKLNFELTETGVIGETPNVIKSIKRLKEIGYNFSLDDFGTGYSNAARLFRVNFRNVKIDKSVLWDSETNPAIDGFLSFVFGIVKSIGCDVIQEGVETEEQLEKVTRLGCKLIQGYYFSKPVNEAEFIKFIQRT